MQGGRPVADRDGLAAARAGGNSLFQLTYSGSGVEPVRPERVRDGSDIRIIERLTASGQQARADG